MRTLVYVSGPITNHPGGPWEGVRSGLVAGDTLIDGGFAPIVPHLAFYWEQEHNHARTGDDFMAIGLATIPRVDAVLRLEGNSQTADLEVAEAVKHNVPVFYEVGELMRKMSGCADRRASATCTTDLRAELDSLRSARAVVKEQGEVGRKARKWFRVRSAKP